MKTTSLFVALLLCIFSCSAQNISGKWYGKIIQGPGELCQICEFELNLTQKKNISGESYTYIKDTTDIRIRLYGYFDRDSIKLKEEKYQIIKSVVPEDWQVCIKSLTLKYQRINNEEFLIGRGTGVTIEDTVCIPARFVLSKSKVALINYFSDSLHIIKPSPTVIAEPISFTPTFLNTIVKNVSLVEVKDKRIQLRISDYLNVDNDSVSVYFNRKILVNKVRISKRPIVLNINLDPAIIQNEIILFAENLGRIPPNTSQLIVIDGNEKHRLIIESDKQKSAAVYITYKPKP